MLTQKNWTLTNRKARIENTANINKSKLHKCKNNSRHFHRNIERWYQVLQKVAEKNILKSPQLPIGTFFLKKKRKRRKANLGVEDGVEVVEFPKQSEKNWRKKIEATANAEHLRFANWRVIEVIADCNYIVKNEGKLVLILQ